MRRLSKVVAYAILLSFPAVAQTPNYPYILKNFAGTFPLGDGGPATSALLYYPNAAVPDANGNLYILDAGNYRIRKVAGQKISTVTQLPIYGYDMKRGADGTLYVSGSGQVLKITADGTVSVLAGTGDYGFTGDGGLATRAQLGDAYGVAVDSTGNVFFSDVSPGSHRIREVTTDGKIRTVAGVGPSGFNGDNQIALSAALDYPTGVAVDNAGSVYIADYNNLRIRKFTVGGSMSTFAGNGQFGQPLNAQAISTRMGPPAGLFIDPIGNVYATDNYFNVVIRITVTGALSVVAGNLDGYSNPLDGAALSVSLRFPPNASADGAGNVFIVDGTHRLRQVTPNGNLTTIAGKLHFAGDNGPATAAFLNEPSDMAFDPQGNALIADAGNYLVRKVTPAGVISTYAGKLNPGVPINNSSIFNVQLPYMKGIAYDSKGSMFLAGYYQVYKITPDGVLTIYAGSGNTGNGGDGGKATAATFSEIGGIAVNAAGDLYIADAAANRVRVVAASTGVISAFAGGGARGRGGDGSLATGALFNFSSWTPLAVDQKNNVYISDGGNYSVRMVNSSGIITTVVGNGTFDDPDGTAPTATGFSRPGGLAVDAAGNLYVSSQTYPELYKLSGGILRLIAGAGTDLPVDGAPALGAIFYSENLKVDANGDVYSVDLTTSSVRKLVLNSPTALTVVDGNAQTAEAGQALPKALKVQLMGRAGIGVAGVTVNFAIASGSGKLSATTTTTDATGLAAVVLTLGSTAGPVSVTASAAGTTLTPAQFTATATAPAATCSVPQPAIVSARSAGDFGGSPAFASGSWLEVKGSNLAPFTRSWGGDDFNGANAPTALDGVTVSIDGKAAFVGYVSPTQINVQAPADTANGALDLIVSAASCPSAAFKVQKAAVAGGLLAPGAFNIGGKQYAAALFPDNVTFVGAPNLIPGVPFRAAAPGDSIVLYGIGFGDVTPTIAPGVVVSTANSIPGLTVAFDTTPATVQFAGLAAQAVGLYQFNVVVPNVPDGDYPIVVKVGGAAIAQTTYLTVHK
jgi:uncharacterized protein (TIGR03437 family)